MSFCWLNLLDTLTCGFLFYRLLHNLHQCLPFFFRDARNADVLLHQLGEGAVVVLGKYFRQLLVDGFFILVLVHNWMFQSFSLQIATT